jgi:hypothetical protein
VSAETILMVLVVLVCFGWIPVVSSRSRGVGALALATGGSSERRSAAAIADVAAASAHLASPSGSTRGPLAWTSVNPDQTP